MVIGISGKMGSGKDTVGKIIQYLTCKVEPKFSIEELLSTSYSKEIEFYSSYKIKKFADKLKDIVCLLIGCTRKELEDQDFKNTELGEEWDRVIYKIIDSDDTVLSETFFEEDADINLGYYSDYHHRNVELIKEESKLTPRLLLQLLGTECGRDIIHPNIWVNALFSNYRPAKMSEDNPSKWIITDMRFPNELNAIKDKGGITIRVNRGLIERTGKVIQTQEHESETALDNADFDYVIENEGSIEELISKVENILIKEKII